jgi:hypothetical protein
MVGFSGAGPGKQIATFCPSMMSAKKLFDDDFIGGIPDAQILNGPFLLSFQVSLPDQSPLQAPAPPKNSKTRSAAAAVDCIMFALLAVWEIGC